MEMGTRQLIFSRKEYAGFVDQAVQCAQRILDMNLGVSLGFGNSPFWAKRVLLYATFPSGTTEPVEEFVESRSGPVITGRSVDFCEGQGAYHFVARILQYQRIPDHATMRASKYAVPEFKGLELAACIIQDMSALGCIEGERIVEEKDASLVRKIIEEAYLSQT